MTTTDEPSEQGQFTDVLARSAELLARFALPIYTLSRGRPTQHGSGFFVRYDGQNFLVSAAHVLDPLRTGDLHIYVAPDTLRKLTGNLVLTHYDGARHKDRIDVGVLRLEGEAQPPYLALNKFAMDVSYLQPNYQPRTGRIYSLIGFPSSKNKVNPISREAIAAPYAYTAPSVPAEEYSRHGYSSDSHIILPINTKRGFGLDGQPRSLPDPHGMSGSPMVVLYNDDGTVDTRVFPVVGVATTYHKRHHLLVATEAQVILEHISIAA